MPSTHLSLNYHVIFSTKEREPCIHADILPRLHEYLGGTLKGLGAAPLAIGGIADHVHLLFGLKATHTLSSILREVKSESTKWLHGQPGMSGFHWQDGYGGYTVGISDLEKVRKYVLSQEEHHLTRTFQEEYLAMLERAGIECDPRYLW